MNQCAVTILHPPHAGILYQEELHGNARVDVHAFANYVDREVEKFLSDMRRMMIDVADEYGIHLNIENHRLQTAAEPTAEAMDHIAQSDVIATVNPPPPTNLLLIDLLQQRETLQAILGYISPDEYKRDQPIRKAFEAEEGKLSRIIGFYAENEKIMQEAIRAGIERAA